MTDKEAKQVATVAETILAMSNEAREELWDRLRKRFCMNCGEKTDGGQCWGCYDSRPD